MSQPGARKTIGAGRKPVDTAATNGGPVRRHSAKGVARAAVRDRAQAALAPQAQRPATERYALAYLESLSPRHLLYPPMDPAAQAKLADAQADLIDEILRTVLDGLGLTPEQHERGRLLIFESLKAATVEGWEPQ